jgi:hypothetical protein
MSARDQEPEQEPQNDLWRFRETSQDPRALSARAADLVDAVRDVPPLPPEALARIKHDVLARRRAGVGLPLALRFALLTGFVLASVATARGGMMLWRRYVAPAASAPREMAAHPKKTPRPIIIEPVASPVVEVPEVAPVPMPVVVHSRREAAPRATAPNAPAPSTTKDEAQLLGRALSRLRQEHDPRGALALLDEYARTFPGGVMAPEALRARLEAVIQMDDRKTALALLDGRGAFAGRLGSDLLLTRAELRASAGRYGDARADFDKLLATTLPGELAGRALYGRAVSLGHLGQDERARGDLLAYQRRFPDGKFAVEVARLLKTEGAANHP